MTTMLPRLFDTRFLLTFLLLFLLTILVLIRFLNVVSVWELPQSPISCESHQDDFFSNDFSPDFDINSIDCRVSWIKNSPTIRFWSTAPYLGIRWPQRVL